MTTPTPELRQEDFEQLLDEHQKLIGLANDVEYCLHALGPGEREENLNALQQAAGTLVSVLRSYLFRQDQQVLPVIENLTRKERPGG